ncbi:response regulator [Cystobacter fuscus]|nr:response regulator [Cystobacter fuscus]
MADLGANVVTAASGDEALRLLLEREFALILLDVQMPGMDGYDTASLIRMRERTRHIPIIYITAFNRSEVNVSRGYELGAVDYLFKPIVPEILRTKVGVFLELHRKKEEVRRQEALLRQAESRAHAQQLAEARAHYERSLLQQEVERERKVSEAREQRAQELAKLVQEKEQAQAELSAVAREREQLILALREADRRKDEFLAMLAHELRNPLAPVRHALEVFQLRAPQDEILQRAFASADRQVSHMTRLVDDLLDVSRITRGKVEIRPRLVTFKEIVDGAIQACDPFIQQRHHSLSVSLPEEPLILNVDPTRMTQVVANLLHNAAKYTPSGGRIELAARRNQGELVLSVRDNGVGLRPEMLQRVFELFVQVDPGSDRAQGGLGLGLTLVRSLVEMHGGRVSAHSQGLSQGSEFIVHLPLPAEATAPLAIPNMLKSAASLGSSLRPLNILLVEDNPDIRETLRDLLELHGHHVAEASDGRAAVELVLSQRPQVALVDIGLPELDGYQVAELVRASAGGADTRLVALTGYGHPEDRKRALAAGFDAHLVKPVSSEDLSQVLKRLCNAA